MMFWLLMVLVAAVVIAAVTLAVLTARLLRLDAAARGLAHPRLIGALGAGTQNGVGILAYLALRRGHPLDAAQDDVGLRTRLKVGSVAALTVLLASGVCAALVLAWWR
ncbi:hypothetical protein [Lacticaseibacillus kribbianus]|uniref:hypothetical protein n=1 Tax=Lacticaseibacillus kribbianus TaxID=2926292 RepID=UPI001CD35FBE|nr:hypothetical protein [Lacticaseibacillus kribbianus]